MKELGTVHVVDDDPAVLHSSELLFESLGIPVRGYASAEQFLAAWRPEMQGCLLLDLRLPGMSGLALQERLRQLGCGLEIVFLTAFGDVPSALHALRAGATHFLTKPAREHDLLEAVNRALRRAEAGRPRVRERTLLRRRLRTLTPREAEVLDHVAAGRPTRVVAGLLGISDRTVEAHRASAFDKLGVRSIAELIRSLENLR